MENPFISVLVIAHDRRKYLIDAVSSVLSQDFPKDKHEVIVVKYRLDGDKEINERLEELGVKVIDTEEESLGAKIAIGAKEAKGDVLAFLEDDDLFLQGKLKRTYYAFAKNPRVGYYHNEMKFINIKDNQEIVNAEKQRKKILSRFEASFDNNEFLIQSLKFWEKIPRLSILFFGFNNSSISLKKDVVLNFEKVYKNSKSNHAVDFLHFLLSLELNYLAAIDKGILTEYRVHSESTMEKKLPSFENQLNYNIATRRLQLYNLALPAKFYNLQRTSYMLDVFTSYIKLENLSYEEILGKSLKTNKLNILIKIFKNDESYIYSPYLLLYPAYLVAPKQLRTFTMKFYYYRNK